MMACPNCRSRSAAQCVKCAAYGAHGGPCQHGACDKCKRRDRRNGTKGARHGVAYIVRDDSEDWVLLRIPGSFYPEQAAAKAYAVERSRYYGPHVVACEMCDGSEMWPARYDAGTLVTATEAKR